MDVLPKLGSIFALAFVSFWASIPAGLALHVAPVSVALTAWSSYTAGVILIARLGEPIRVRLLARFGGKATANPDAPIRWAWDRFGLLGLSLLAPVTTGAQIGALIGLSLGIPPRKLILGMTLGGALWSTGLTLAATLGLAVVRP
ncbi:MAG: small multi-drug export protein [Anaerolineae bacterium]|nr:small multi-drug export protein [Anaerolineae bacterium]